MPLFATVQSFLRNLWLGVAIGLTALALTGLLANQPYEVSEKDPVTFAGLAWLLILVALAACDIPARRAMRVVHYEWKWPTALTIERSMPCGSL